MTEASFIDPVWDAVYSVFSSDIRRLSFVNRFSSIPVTLKENVMEHLGWVTFYSMVIHQQVSGDDELLGEVLSHAIVHDLPEMVTGDVVRTFKYSSEEFKESVEKAEKNYMDRVHSGLKFFYKKGTTHEREPEYIKAVVKAADFVALQQFLMREIMVGNELIKPFVNRMISDLNEQKEKCLQSKDLRIQNIGMLYGELALKSIQKEIPNFRI